MAQFIRGQKTYLRNIELSDVNETYLSWLNDLETTKGLLAGRFPSSLVQLQSYVENAITDNNTVMFAICNKENDQHIGNIKLDNFDWVGRTCELGVLIGDQNSWGKGIGTEVCEMVINYAFDHLNLRKILLAVYSNNPGAIKLYEKLGFKQEGRFIDHLYAEGKYIDKIFMGIFKESNK